MNHSFHLGTDNKCAKCHRDEIAHGSEATCDACPNIGPCELYHSLLLCAECMNKELQHNSPESQENRVIEFRKQSIDQSIQVKSDLFNAEITSIESLRLSIAEDNSIENKHFELARLVKERIIHFQKIIFERNEQNVNDSTKQRASQSYLNDLANKLHSEEREKLKLSDITYKPNEVKITKPKIGPKKGFDKAEVRRIALECGMPESVIQMLCIAKNLTPQQAGETFKSIKRTN